MLTTYGSTPWCSTSPSPSYGRGGTWLRFGEIPGQDLLALIGTTEISDEQARMLREGMEVLVGYLASVRDGWEDEDAQIH